MSLFVEVMLNEESAENETGQVMQGSAENETERLMNYFNRINLNAQNATGQFENTELYEESLKFFTSLKELLGYAFKADVHYVHRDGEGNFTDVGNGDKAGEKFQSIIKTIERLLLHLKIYLDDFQDTEEHASKLKKALSDCFQEIKPILDELKEKKTALDDCLEQLKQNKVTRDARDEYMAEFFSAANIVGYTAFSLFALITIVAITPLGFMLSLESVRLEIPTSPTDWFSGLTSAVVNTVRPTVKDANGNASHYYDVYVAVALFQQLAGIFSITANYVAAPKEGLKQHFALFLEYYSVYLFGAAAAYKTLKKEKGANEWALLRDMFQFVPTIGYTAYKTRIVKGIESVIGDDKQDVKKDNANKLFEQTSKHLHKKIQGFNLNNVVRSCLARKVRIENLMVSLHQLSLQSKYNVSRLKPYLGPDIAKDELEPLAIAFGKNNEDEFNGALEIYKKSFENNHRLQNRLMLPEYTTADLTDEEMVELLCRMNPNPYSVAEPEENLP